MSNEAESLKTPVRSEPKAFPATVIQVLSEHKVVINRGTEHGLKEGDRFLVYGLGQEELRDPETGEPLGLLEIVRGTGKVVHAQEKIATVQSIMEQKSGRKVVQRKPSGFLFSSPFETETIEYPQETNSLPFDEVKPGDKARPL